MSSYRGRFAPSPTGPLHFGSLAAALGSYLAAKHHNGAWLVRIEDLDTPRCIKGAADRILRTLERYGLYWDEAVIFQSQRQDAYEDALQRLQAMVYPCCCTRREIADSALHGMDGQIYPGSCRNGMPSGREGRGWRVRTDKQRIEFNDAVQGHFSQDLEGEIGDFIVKRADGLFAYQLAVVVDDAFQGITQVVRGADLLASTPRQIYLQRLLGLPTPHYLHLPIALNAAGEKLGKQTQAPAVSSVQVVETLIEILKFLRQNPPAELQYGSVAEVLAWAALHWQQNRLKD
jgi:glutamyl-Q tRNA(Asp) synthetase